MKCKVLLISALLVISGCSSIEAEKPVNYYVLDAKPNLLASKRVEKTLLVEAVLLPDYLNQPNLVLRDSTQKLHVAYYHSWADDLASAIRRVVLSELNYQSKKYRFTARCNDCDTVTIALDHFYPTTQGEVILAGEYQLKIGAEQQITRKDFLIKVALTKDGYEHSVKQMRVALDKLVMKINASLNRQAAIAARLQEVKALRQATLDIKTDE